MKSAPTIAFDYRPSRRVAAAALVASAAAALAPWLSALPSAASIAVSLGVLAVTATGISRFLRPPIRRIAHGAAGWTLVDGVDVEHAAILVSKARLGSLLALGFRYGPKAHLRALITADNLDADRRRRLVLLLARTDVADDA